MHMDHIWHQISKQIDLYFGQPRFKNLVEFDKFQLLIPHSNSYCKGIFNTVRKICTDGRYNLRSKDATLGHASINVYTEAISIRNNILGILMPKISIFGKKLACYKWEPIKCILAQVKSTTYKKLQVRKNKNNKQQLMRTQKTELKWSSSMIKLVVNKPHTISNFPFSSSMIFKACYKPHTVFYFPFTSS